VSRRGSAGARPAKLILRDGLAGERELPTLVVTPAGFALVGTLSLKGEIAA
jgi:hypothetical protein